VLHELDERNSPCGKFRLKISFSSGELTVMVQTVFGSAIASSAGKAKSSAASKAAFMEEGIDDGEWDSPRSIARRCSLRPARSGAATPRSTRRPTNGQLDDTLA
jgi:hypothetical protein